MNIALICEHASPLAALGGVDSGGQNVYIAQVAMQMASRGHRVDVFTRRCHADQEPVVPLGGTIHAELRPHGIKVTAVIAGGMRTPFLLERFPELDPACLQEPANVAAAVIGVLSLPSGSVMPEISVLPMGETSWP